MKSAVAAGSGAFAARLRKESVSTLTCAPAIADPCGSVTMPVIAAVCVWARRGDGEKNTNRKAEKQRKKQNTDGKTHEEPPLPSRAGGKGCPRVRDRFRLSRLRTPSVSWLGGTAPRGLPAPAFGTVARAEFFPPYSRAAATGLHRLPGTESAVNVAERFAWPGLAWELVSG